MSFFSIIFLLFIVVFAGVYYLVPTKMQNVTLLCANIIFYLSYNIPTAFVLLFEILLSFFLTKQLQKDRTEKEKKGIVAFMIVLIVGILVIFKYLGFFCNSCIGILNLLNCNISPVEFNILVPLGISFFTFKIISYVIDVYNGKIECESDIIKYSVYVSFFPQISSGPIERAGSFLPLLSTQRKICYDNIIRGMKTILWGIFKKMVIADNLAVTVNNVFDDVHSYTGPILFIAAALFSIQLYCDFSGYSDIAVGLSSILGFSKVNNFASPYLSVNMKEFWDRWHISLSSWLRDYIYFPLGGSRVSVPRHYLNLLIVFLVSGLWHGASMNFIIWGFINGIYVVGYNIYKRICNKINGFSNPFGKIDCIVFNFLLATFAWIFFRANSLSDSIYIFRNMTDLTGFSFSQLMSVLNNIGLSKAALIIQLLSFLILLSNDIIQKRYNELLINRISSIVPLYLYALLLISLIFIAGYYGPTMDSQAFIYMNF